METPIDLSRIRLIENSIYRISNYRVDCGEKSNDITTEYMLYDSRAHIFLEVQFGHLFFAYANSLAYCREPVTERD